MVVAVQRLTRAATGKETSDSLFLVIFRILVLEFENLRPVLDHEYNTSECI